MTQAAAQRSQIDWRYHLVTLVLSAWTALLLCYFLTLLIFTTHNNDQSWYLYAAQRVLTGAHISGSELIETNPPLIIWFSVVPAFLGRSLHLDAYLMLEAVVFVMVIASVAWCARILRITGAAQSRALLFIRAGSVLSAEIFMSGFVVGQREHLLVILILPYILSATLSGKSRLPFAELCAIGIAAGIAVCFKPQDVLILFALELFLALATCSLRRLVSPDFLFACAAVLTYIALVQLATPLYFSSIMPLLRQTYWGLGIFSAASLILGTYIFDVAFILALAILLICRQRLRSPLVPAAFLACSLASSIAYFTQHTGGEYRSYPQEAFLLLAIIWIAADLFTPTLSRWKFNQTFAMATLIFALMISPLAITIAYTLQRFEPPPWRVPDAILADYPQQTPVFLFSTTPDAMRAVLQHHLVWASRFPCLWMLPAIVQNEAAEAGGPTPRKVLPQELVRKLGALQRADTTEDFRRWEPSVVVVQQCHKSDSFEPGHCWGLANLDFDPVAWFLQSPEFAAEWANYRLQSTRQGYDIYTRLNSAAPTTALSPSIAQRPSPHTHN